MTDHRPPRNMPTIIASAANEKFRTWKSLLSSKGIKKDGLAILSGQKLIQEFLSAHGNEVSAELRLETQKSVSPATQFILAKELFAELDELGTHSNLLVIKTKEFPEWKVDLKAGLVLFLPLGNPSNLGAAIRSAVSFGAMQIVLTKESANPYLPKALKASAGSLFSAQIFKGPSLLELPADTIALDQGGLDLPTFQWPKLSYLVVGEEGPGLQNFKPKTKVSIPIQNVESLNATVATSIALYDWKLKTGN